jgi:hypothetical protein
MTCAVTSRRRSCRAPDTLHRGGELWFSCSAVITRRSDGVFYTSPDSALALVLEASLQRDYSSDGWLVLTLRKLAARITMAVS